MASPTPLDNVVVPLNLDAFVLNEAVCSKDPAKAASSLVAPITQPNYVSLRLQNSVLQVNDSAASLSALDLIF
jgi:hypothetical protein